jgi:hypothetical protein
MAQATRDAIQFRQALTFNPTLLAANDNTAMIGAEHRFKDRLFGVLDAGYIFGSYYFRDNILKGTRGFALRPSLKYYNKTGKTYYQFQVSYKQVRYRLLDWLGKSCVDDVPTYEQFQEFPYRKRVLAFNLLAGQLYRITDAVFLELYAGAGVKLTGQKPTEPGSCYRYNEQWIELSNFRERHVAANVPLGFKVLVAIR